MAFRWWSWFAFISLVVGIVWFQFLAPFIWYCLDLEMDENGEVRRPRREMRERMQEAGVVN
jgi:hypothetical protein